MPILRLEALRRINDEFIFNASVQGGWINRWNSLRNEGGIVWASQNQVEGHLRMLYSNRASLVRCNRCSGFSSTTTDSSKIQ